MPALATPQMSFQAELALNHPLAVGMVLWILCIASLSAWYGNINAARAYLALAGTVVSISETIKV
ncbi:hypothetical protein CAC42_4215 [Sphaceloma murrayae]|uniref:Uncharacterized protein n=1 Tax=Sphaceloma murrayae TaxID=2082308 RepID=A0A2K1QLS3_9PEZI|nr:hypothetical protein CAC42_4215 [Sphaceloma murrayae]